MGSFAAGAQQLRAERRTARCVVHAGTVVQPASGGYCGRPRIGFDGRTVPVTISPDRFDTVIFDLDGVVTRTARTHAAAWKRTFDELLAGNPAERPFTDDDYRRFVDGRPRLAGVRTFLASRGIALPEGGPGDRPGTATVWGLGSRKNALYRAEIGRGGVEVFDDAVRLLDRLRDAGIRVAVVTGSRNCADVLRAAGLSGRFAAGVDGNDVARLGLTGKPMPDAFLEAAARLRVSPERAAVVEDAESGVQAARAGGFGLVVGVDRTGRARDALIANGAGVVVNRLDELAVASPRGARAD
jgi:trehalose 6-phosphate phosphatase